MNSFSYPYQASYFASVNQYSCEYCPETFPTKSERTHHTTVHFTSKTCNDCNQSIICINGDWYSLHNSLSCNKENDFTTIEEAPMRLEPGALKGEIEQNDDFDDSILKLEPETSLIEDKIETSSLILSKKIVEVKLENDGAKAAVFYSSNSKRGTASVPATTASLSTTRKSSKRPKRTNSAKKRFPPTKFMDHRPASNLTCDICKKVLGTYNTMKAHMVNFHIPREKERFSCTECNLTLANPFTLKAHLRTHMKSKAFVCTYCGRGFNQLYNLQQHTNHHTGLKPYKCTLCEKAFGRKTNLVAHTRVHTGEKPFKCPIDGCDRAYMFEIDLKRHKYSVHGIYTKKHICPICAKVYSENKLLKKHLESHSGFS